MIQPSRRSLITGLISFMASPAIVRASSLMPINPRLVAGEGWEWSPYFTAYPIGPTGMFHEFANETWRTMCGLPLECFGSHPPQAG